MSYTGRIVASQQSKQGELKKSVQDLKGRQELLMHEIELENLIISRYNVRRELGDIDELVDSIKQVGILEPLIVRPSSPYIFEIIVGQRRYYAARKAGLRKVPCIIRKMSDEEAIVASLIENVQRGDITEEEIARAFLTLRERNYEKWSQEEFSKQIGKSQPWVSGILTAYQSLIKLRALGIAKGMKSYPKKEDREKGIVPVEHLKEIEYALRSKNVRNILSENEIEKIRIDLAKAILDLPIEEAKQIINAFKTYPGKEVNEEILGGALKRKARLALRTKTESSKSPDSKESTTVQVLPKSPIQANLVTIQKGETEFTVPADMLYKYYTSFLPYTMTLYQLYLEDCLAKGLKPPSLSKWVNICILQLYRTHIGKLQFTPISREVKTGLEG